MENAYINRLQTICCPSGFKKKGNTFFRVHGDGVFQVIKYHYERRFQAYTIDVGLFSMYGNLPQRYFSASGCVASYFILNCVNQNDLPLVSVPDIAVQLDILESRGIAWLDTVDTQKRLISTIRKLNPLWNDSNKVDPYLACGEINHARKVVYELVGRHDTSAYKIAQASVSERGQHNDEDEALLAMWQMLTRADIAEIDTYLQNNYARNMNFAKFCTK